MRALLAAALASALTAPAGATLWYVGSGKDGAKTVAGNTTENAVHTNITAFVPPGGDTVTVGAAGAFNPGDLVLLYQTWGTGAGTYELARIASKSPPNIFLTTGTKNGYQSTGAQILVVKEYSSVSQTAGTWQAPAYNGLSGGVFAVAVTGNFSHTGGSIDMAGLGLPGGGPGISFSQTGFQGSGVGAGAGARLSGANSNGGGGGGFSVGDGGGRRRRLDGGGGPGSLEDGGGRRDGPGQARLPDDAQQRPQEPAVDQGQRDEEGAEPEQGDDGARPQPVLEGGPGVRDLRPQAHPLDRHRVAAGQVQAQHLLGGLLDEGVGFGRNGVVEHHRGRDGLDRGVGDGGHVGAGGGVLDGDAGQELRHPGLRLDVHVHVHDDQHVLAGEDPSQDGLEAGFLGAFQLDLGFHLGRDLHGPGGARA